MPSRHVTDQQMRLFMTHRQTHTVSVAAAKAVSARRRVEEEETLDLAR
jgi:hypothetical protein